MNSTEKAFNDSLNSLLKGSFPKDGKLLVAFSGGIDSLALLVLAVRTLGKEAVHPVYVNHNLRSRSELQSEILLNTFNCRKLGLELEVVTLQPGQVKSLSEQRKGGTEDSARVLRYALLEESRVANSCQYIATAHHRQDQTETVIMHLINGSPLTSLGGIREKDDSRHIIRPLLGFEKSELKAYLRENGFTPSQDSTNEETDFERNRIRNVIIPNLREAWPGFQDAIESIKVPENALLCIRMRFLYDLWDQVFPRKELPQSLIRRVTDAMSEGRDFTISANGATFTQYHGALFLSDDGENQMFESFNRPIDPTGNVEIKLPGGLLFRSNCCAKPSDTSSKDIYMDPSAFRGNVTLRFAKEGDSICLKGGRKTVLRLLQDMGIPPAFRKRVPVLEDEDGICAVFGKALGGKDRICVKFISSLALGELSLYIVSKG